MSVNTTRNYEAHNDYIRTVCTALSLFQLTNDYEGSIGTIKPILHKTLIDRVDQVMKAGHVASNEGAKRQKIDLASTPMPESLETQLKVLSFSNRLDLNEIERLSREKPELYRRAQLRAVSREILPAFRRTFFEWHQPIGRTIFAFLETREICRVGCSSLDLNYQVSQFDQSKLLWKEVSKTFRLPDIYWEKFSKETVRENLQLLKRVNLAFAFCFRKDVTPGRDGETLRQKVVKFAKIQDAECDKPLPLENPRRCFVEYTRPLVEMIQKGSPAPCQAFHEMLLCNMDQAPKTLEMFYACGEKGNGRTYNYFSGPIFYLSNFPQDVPSIWFTDAAIHEWNDNNALGWFASESHATFSLETLEMTMKYGTPPESIMGLLIAYCRAPSRRLGEIMRALIEQGATKRVQCSHFIRRGPLELTKLFIEKSNAIVGPEDLSMFLQMASLHATDREVHVSPLTADYILSVIELLLARQPERRPYDFGVTAMPFPDLFAGMARFESEKLMAKLVELGYGPNNDGTKRSSLGRALSTECRYPCMQATAGPHEFVFGGCPYNVIELLCKFGAKPPAYLEEYLSKYYAQVPLLLNALRNLFNPRSSLEEEFPLLMDTSAGEGYDLFYKPFEINDV